MKARSSAWGALLALVILPASAAAQGHSLAARAHEANIPLPGLELVLVFAGGETRTAITGWDGIARWHDAPAGRAIVRVEEPGYEPATRPVAVPSNELLDLPLEPAGEGAGSAAREAPGADPSLDDGAPSAPSSASGDPVLVVTSARLVEALDDAVSAVQVIDRQAIEEGGFRDAAEALEEQSGLQIERTFAGAELWLRGLDPAYTLVLVDGERLPGRTAGAIDLSRFGAESIERIEIVRGPSSALYGSSALGGVVNILTRESDRDFEADGMASYGSGNILDVSGRVAGRASDTLRLQAFGGFHRADSFSDDGADTTRGSARTLASGGGKLEWTPDGTHRLRLSGAYSLLDLAGVDDGAGAALFDRSQRQEQSQVSAEHRIQGEDIELVSRVGYSLYREQYLLDQRGGSQLDQYEDNQEHLLQLSSVGRYTFDDFHETTAGFEYFHQSLDSQRLSTSGRRSRFAVFAQHEWVVFEDDTARLIVVPGVRLDLDSQFGEQVSPKLAMRLDLAGDVALRASYGRGFRAPSFQQLLLRFENPSVGYVVQGNPDLGAETSHGVDVGAAWEATDWLTLSASFFRNDLSNMIAIVTREEGASGTLFSYDNLQTAWTMGVEVAAAITPVEELSLRVGTTWTETWDGENERPLEGRAVHRPTASVRVHHPDWDLGATVRGAVLLGREFFIDDGSGAVERVVGAPLVQVDARVFKRFTRHLELFVGVDNLAGAQDRFSALRPRTFYGGARGRY